VKPLFLDTAWNYIAYPGQQVGGGGEQAGAGAQAEEEMEVESEAAEPEAKPQKKGWFGFGR
jgi:signal recognition particle subunit SRP68